MTRSEAQRLVLSRVADTLEGLGISEVIPRDELYTSFEDRQKLCFEFGALIRELRKRGAETSAETSAETVAWVAQVDAAKKIY